MLTTLDSVAFKYDVAPRLDINRNSDCQLYAMDTATEIDDASPLGWITFAEDCTSAAKGIYVGVSKLIPVYDTVIGHPPEQMNCSKIETAMYGADVLYLLTALGFHGIDARYASYDFESEPGLFMAFGTGEVEEEPRWRGLTLYVGQGREPHMEPDLGQQQGAPLAHVGYTVKENDTLWDIAARFTGQGEEYGNIIAEVTGDPDVIDAGSSVYVPVIVKEWTELETENKTAKGVSEEMYGGPELEEFVAMTCRMQQAARCTLPVFFDNNAIKDLFVLEP